ncbi:MAG: hypothetical protein ACREQR_08000 [Candidatus Binataceae bacterium]
MNDDRIAGGRVAAFARAANRVGVGARASVQIAQMTAIRKGAGALARVVRALNVPAHAKPARGSHPAADAAGAHESSDPAPRGSARSLAAVIAAASALPVPIVPERESHTAVERSATQAERRSSAPRVALANTLSVPRAASVALSRVRQFARQTTAGPDVSPNRGGSRKSAAPETISPREPSRGWRPSYAAMIAQSSAMRLHLQSASNIPAAPGAIAGNSATRGAGRLPDAVAEISARIRRVLASARGAVPAAGGLLSHGDPAYPARERGSGGTLRGERSGAGAAAPITINSSPSITVNLPPGTAVSGEREISRAVAQALEEHAEWIYELMRRIGAFRERAEF